MKLDTEDSDVFHAIGYDDEVQILELIFNSGQIYQYRGVPHEVYDQLMKAESKGNYFHENIRDEFEHWQWDSDMAKFKRTTKGEGRTTNG
jgi:hypothetical protein